MRNDLGNGFRISLTLEEFYQKLDIEQFLFERLWQSVMGLEIQQTYGIRFQCELNIHVLAYQICTCLQFLRLYCYNYYLLED